MLEISDIRDATARFGYGGDALNTAIYLARSGRKPEFVSALGDDAFSTSLRAKWNEEGVGLDHCLTVEGGKPGLYAISVDADGERRFTYWRSDSAARRFFEHEDASVVIEAMERAEFLYLTGITLSILTPSGRTQINKILMTARAKRGEVAFDINYRPSGWASLEEARRSIAAAQERVSIGFVSTEDWALLHGTADAPAIAEDWRAKGCREVIVKDGARGCYLLTDEESRWVSPQSVVSPVDTTGAGDAFNGAYLASRAKGDSPLRACEAGNALAARVTLFPGAIIPREDTSAQ